MRTWIFGVATLVVATLLALAGAEAIARTALAVRQTRPPLDDGLPVLQEPDEVLGWRNKAGSVVWPGRGEDGGKDIRMTFWADGLRATAPAPELDRPQVVVIGCSYTQGWAVTDAETYPWRLQAEFPSHAFLNYGTAGYGTYQSLLALERYFAAGHDSPALVIYGFIDYHEERNVAPAGWLKALATASRAGTLSVPFVSIGADGNLERHRLDRANSWPLRSHLASVAAIEDRVLEFRTRGRLEQRRQATDRLLLELQRVTRDHGSDLLVAILESRDEAKEHVVTFAAQKGIEAVDCTVPNQDELQVPGYSHPDRRINAHWAQCIGDRVRGHLSPSTGDAK
ncbi:MAG TPA: hypothetical protein VFD21_04570 [Vicinamibacterales bacterium]|jgi:hypothetical protein|nr:hypothetical protein [Vicinamibacterales bacterium]